jgi:hypothetical protein
MNGNSCLANKINVIQCNMYAVCDGMHSLPKNYGITLNKGSRRIKITCFTGRHINLCTGP